ncbi:MAG TPA: R3H domain-containing nucleic acid-binding protein [Candidatus Paceibacterota bacterium]|jgi:predicted RNA-binding protein Jag|nr:R3H domain-containing nucleic acid-binding protein [Candidatus Paceibacterota bacterium]
MEQWDEIAKRIAEGMGFGDYRVEIKPEEKRGSLFIYDGGDALKSNLPSIVESVNHLFQMIAKKNGVEVIFLDVNNYRQERETLIAELARAAAKKAVATKGEVSLPAMNSYERRIVHVALAVHPEVKTESAGEGKERYVIVKPI